MTVLDLINAAARKLGVISSGENVSASEAQDGLSALNTLLDTWQTERLLVYGILPQTFALVPGQVKYTLGASGNWNYPRPVNVDSMFLLYTGVGGQPEPLNLPINLLNKDQYNAIIVPNTTSPIPTAAYIDDASPLRNVYIWPVPQVNYSVNLFVWTAIPQFAAITTVLNLPPGYQRALLYNLALEMAPEYGLVPSSAVAGAALDAKGSLKRLNSKTLLMSCDPAVTGQNGGWNYLTGE